MPRIIVFAQVDDAAKWEEGFRSHGALFREMTQTVAYFCTTEQNEVVICDEVDDLGKYFEMMGSPAVAEAMAADGVKPESVRVYVLDKEFRT